MAKIGDAFSEDHRRASVRRRLKPGTVVHLELAFPEGRRWKYLVVAHVDDECCTFIVNSRVNPFIRRRPELAVCQVRVDAARHPFLRHDSHIDCHKVLRLPTEAVIRDLAVEMSRFKGALHADVRTQVIAAIKRAPTLSPNEQQVLADALDADDD